MSMLLRRNIILNSASLLAAMTTAQCLCLRSDTGLAYSTVYTVYWPADLSWPDPGTRPPPPQTPPGPPQNYWEYSPRPPLKMLIKTEILWSCSISLYLSSPESDVTLQSLADTDPGLSPLSSQSPHSADTQTETSLRRK